MNAYRTTDDVYESIEVWLAGDVPKYIGSQHRVQGTYIGREEALGVIARNHSVVDPIVFELGGKPPR